MRLTSTLTVETRPLFRNYGNVCFRPIADISSPSNLCIMHRRTTFGLVVAALVSGCAAPAVNSSPWTLDELSGFHLNGMSVRVDGYLVNRYFVGSELQPYALVSAERNASTGLMECGTKIATIDSRNFHPQLNGSEPQHVILTGRYEIAGPNDAYLTGVNVEQFLPDHCTFVVRVILGGPTKTQQ